MRTEAQTNCPVAALADEAHKLIEIKNAADKVSIDDGATADEKLKAERAINVADRFLKGVVERATFLQPESAKGALFQLCAISDLVADMEGCVLSKGFVEGRLATINTPKDREAEELAIFIARALDSTAAYIEETTGARREDACGDYYIARDLSDHTRLAAVTFVAGQLKEPDAVGAEPKGARQ